ncbi:MAG: hypothetical protein UX47_C0006G0124 [Candidatus Collierbacteria bacterium GW2011_GWA2_46_26]|uniref:Uncharacterized protein n=1 Tax=Candidatus Collierbacteria bacterium GW2011_GWA2_46_26 TaxID=1618381 RepID=A0A0G1RT86_9BACT|nr:MAG: hypothetical protein UW29_C0005G0013 [Candidatus Collierbacteria bacterium GW2011_GWC2_44_13]KKU33153.1 MAG: hypothetical protein UX47_C0006G0124 [Candidatus Collierbacteria bacterium GW2011_GWA2_46_26]
MVVWVDVESHQAEDDHSAYGERETGSQRGDRTTEEDKAEDGDDHDHAYDNC